MSMPRIERKWEWKRKNRPTLIKNTRHEYRDGLENNQGLLKIKKQNPMRHGAWGRKRKKWKSSFLVVSHQVVLSKYLWISKSIIEVFICAPTILLWLVEYVKLGATWSAAKNLHFILFWFFFGFCDFFNVFLIGPQNATVKSHSQGMELRNKFGCHDSKILN